MKYIFCMGGIRVIKLIIVEDEPLMNKFIVNSINWEEMGIVLCGTFFNGQAAFEYIEDNAVDVVLSDIEMPIMDGLSLLEKTVSEYPDIKFIFLTNFDDLKMVKQAFRYGALDYILKADFSQETFCEVFSEVAPKIKATHNSHMTDYVIKEYALKEYFWNGKIGQWGLKNLRIDVESRHAIAVIRISNYKDIFDTQCNVECANIKPELSACINETLESYKNGEFFFSNYNEIIFYFSVSSSGSIPFDYKGLFSKIIEMLNTRFNLKLLAGIYDRDESCSIQEQYYQVEKSFRYSLILG
ncbi:MAG: response regulator, partial [Odoribacter sp.]|nr:response regulator [Odoribacter sp.]